MKARTVKALLWLLLGIGAPVLLMRLIHGPGSVTALDDIIPWGLWKGGGVVALVALGGAGFTLAMFTYVFQWKQFKPVVRGAVLLALLAYSSVGLGLTIDIGIPWRIVFPVVHWQVHSVLFEVAWCIMLYLGVLVFEFSHTVLERLGYERALKAVHRLTIVFVIAGISLSTLHQSSLGTLFLATPFRMHPLWHTDFLPLLFFISAMAVGCLTICLITLIVHWLYDAAPPTRAIAGLGRIGAYLMAAYLALRFIEILVAGEGGLLFVADLDTLNFWVEIILSAALPLVLLLRRPLRESPRAMFWISLFAAVGFSLNRVNVAGIATLTRTHSLYWPAWTEWAVTLAILAGAGLVYLFVVEHFSLFKEVTERREEAPSNNGINNLFYGAQHLAEPRLYSFAFIFAAALSFGLLDNNALYGVQPDAVAAQRPRAQLAHLLLTDGRPALVKGAGSSSTTVALLIDGNRNERSVLFGHQGHIARLGEDPSVCGTCHHMNKPASNATSCAECHTDMYSAVEIFNHDIHEEKLGGNDGCVKCHTDPGATKVRANTPDCKTCHEEMRVAGSRIKPTEKQGTLATGYMDAMHGLCIDCHTEKEEVKGQLTNCTTCHSNRPEQEPAEVHARRQQ